MTCRGLAPTIGVMPDNPDSPRHRRLRLVLDEHERERSDVAHELHEHLAQALAAVLLGLDALARDSSSAGATSRIAGLRAQVAQALCLGTQLAVHLRPPLLDQLGLSPALESLAQRAGVRWVAVDPALAGVQLGQALQTDVYRAVEEALTEVSGERSVAVWLDPVGGELCAVVRALDADAAIGDLGRLEARLELIGGTLVEDGGELAVRIPLEPGAGAAIAAFPQPRRVEIPDGERRAFP